MMSGATIKQDETSESETRKAALGDVASHARFWLIGLAALWLDLWSKKWVFAHLAPDETRSFITNFIVFRRSVNDGAVFVDELHS